MIQFLLLTLLLAPATQPATMPTSQPAMETLWDGRIHFEPPPGWTLIQKSANDLQANYKSPDGRDSITVLVSPQEQVISDAMAHQLAGQIIKKIKDESSKTGANMLIPPRIETDDRFLLCVHDRWQTTENIGDRVQRYKQKGLALVLVVSQAMTDNAAEDKAVHTAAATILENTVLTRSTAKPATKPARRSGR